MTWHERQLLRNGPLYCTADLCVEFRKREPEFAARIQRAGIIAHYMGVDPLTGGECFMLSGITPISRHTLTRMVNDSEEMGGSQ